MGSWPIFIFVSFFGVVVWDTFSRDAPFSDFAGAVAHLNYFFAAVTLLQDVVFVAAVVLFCKFLGGVLSVVSRNDSQRSP